jgi:hypothetical protein
MRKVTSISEHDHWADYAEFHGLRNTDVRPGMAWGWFDYGMVAVIAALAWGAIWAVWSLWR